MEPTFPNQKYTSIETEELERLRSQASKGSMAPHVFAQMVNRVRDLAFDFGTTEQFRNRVSELLGEYIDPDAKAPAVVVPEQVRDCQGIPTEVAAIGDEYKFLIELESDLQGWREFGDVNSANFAQALVAQRKADCTKRLNDALRASQGGTTT